MVKLANLPEDHPYMTSTWNNLGNCFNELGDYEKAKDFHLKALKIEIKTFGEKHPDVAGSYLNLGNCYSDMGERDKAIDYIKKGLSIFLEIFGEQNLNVAWCYENIGNNYAALGNLKTAIEYQNKALDIKTKILGSYHSDVGISINNLAKKYQDSGLYDLAIQNFQKASENLIVSLGAENPYQALTFNNIGTSFLNKIEPENSLIFFQKALIACRYKEGDFSKVISFKELLFGLHHLSLTTNIQYNQTNLPQELNRSYSYIFQALTAINYQQIFFLEVGSKSFWRSQNYPIYEQAISVSLLKANEDKNYTLRQNTFTYAEKSKASLLQAQIKTADAINFSGIPDSLLQKEHDLRIDITWREKQRQTLLDKGLTETDTNTLRISSIIFDLKRDYEALKNASKPTIRPTTA
jgi:tetratricopeptide (TPR) repeat protein